MSSAQWTELATLRAKQLPQPLLEALGLPSGKWVCVGDAATEFQPMPSLGDMSKWTKAFASLGRCSVAVGLYMAGALKQLHYNKTDHYKVQWKTGVVQVLGSLEAGYYHLLSDSFVVPYQFHGWWRLVHTPPGLIGAPGFGADLCMPPVQNLTVDGGGGMPNIDPPTAQRPWLPHQCRSFRWMVYREAVKDLFVCESSTAMPAGLGALEIEWKMNKAFDLRGGVLCDPVGSGKTATMLALVLHDAVADHWACEVKDVVSDFFSSSWLTINATLVLCPDHVHEQWVKEVGTALKDNAIEVLSLRTVIELRGVAPQLKKLTEKQAAGVHKPVLVVVALSVIQDPEYQELISPSNKDLKVWLEGTDEWRRGMALDCFVWRRLIIDEVHEIVHLCSAKCSTNCSHMCLIRHLRALKSERRWGLTGTADEVLRDAKSVQSMAQVFRADFNSEASSSRFIEHYCRTNQVDVPARVREEMVVIEHTGAEKLIYEQHARDFSAAGLDGTGERPLSTDELVAAVPLLKLCSHFNIDELSHFQKTLEGQGISAVLTASDIARSIFEMKLQTMEHASAAVGDSGPEESKLMGAEDAKPQGMELTLPTVLLKGLWAEPQMVDGEPKVIITRIEPTAQAQCPGLNPGDMLTSLGGKPVFDFARRLQQRRTQLKEQEQDEPLETGLAALSHDLQVEQRDLQVRQDLKEVLQVEMQNRAGPHSSLLLTWRCRLVKDVAKTTFLDKQSLAAKHVRWHNATSSFVFTRRLYETLCANDHELKRSCPVCLEDFDAAVGGAVLRCGHLFCTNCSKTMFGSKSRTEQRCCPLCRLQVTSMTDVIDLKEFAACRSVTAANQTSKLDLESLDGHHGSKFQSVAEVLRGILATGDERAIVFCQFADLELQISSALSDIGIVHSRLSAARDIFEQTATLDSFQQKRGKSRVLLLSLEQSASGTNLTAANHVLLIHPMAASTVERALAFEQQAIGRCVRLGQKRAVTVWRFITRGTVEEVLDNRFADQRHSYMGGKSRSPATSGFTPHAREPSGSAREAAMALRQAPSRPGRLSRGGTRRSLSGSCAPIGGSGSGRRT